MKVTRPAVFTLLCLTTGEGLLASADKKFAPRHEDGSSSNDGWGHIKTAVNFGKSDAKIEVCPSGDCTNGGLMRLTLARIEEIGTNGKVVQKASNYNKAEGDWSELSEREVDGAVVASTSYVSKILVSTGNSAAEVDFNLTASIFVGNTTVMNGEQEIFVPAGGLKFTIEMGQWPFETEDNSLSFAVKLESKGKGGKSGAKPKKKEKAHGSGSDGGAGRNAKIDRVDMGDGMFMDAPALAFADGVEVEITSAVVEKGSGVEFQWDFPYFKESLYYDPVLATDSAVSAEAEVGITSDTGSSSASTSASASTSSSGGTSTGSSSTTASSASVSTLSLSSVAVCAFAALAYSLY